MVNEGGEVSVAALTTLAQLSRAQGVLRTHILRGTGSRSQLRVGLKPDILMECSGAPSVVRDVLRSTASGGIVCLVGVTEAGHDFNVDVGALNRTMVLDNDTVFGTVNANRRHYEMAGEALRQADKAWLDALITRREPVEQWTQSLHRQPDDIKVIVDFLLTTWRTSKTTR